MNEQEALSKMVAPGTRRPGKYRSGVIQIHVTRACDKACFGCTQGSNLGGQVEFIKPELFEQAVLSLRGYWGVVGVFGGNPALHPKFTYLCDIIARYIPWEQRGLWCNNPIDAVKAEAMRKTFNPAVSNLNVHLDRWAYELFKKHWPESSPVGLHDDSRHSPPYVAMKDVLLKEFEEPGLVSYDESRAWELISDCDINKHWSAMIGVFRGQLRAWFCEIAGAQAMLHHHEPDYPDTGIPIPTDPKLLIADHPTREFVDSTGALCRGDLTHYYEHWWQLPMISFRDQVRKHCHECGVPLRGYGELAQANEGTEQVSATHADIYRPKRPKRLVENVTRLEQLGMGRLQRMTDYIGNAKR